MHEMNMPVKHSYSSGGFAQRGPTLHHDLMNISSIRKQRRLNQTQLAEMTNLSQSTISRAENGLDSATLGDLKSIAEALGVPLYELFTTDRTTAELEILRLFRLLPPERQQGWIEMAKVAATDRPQA